MDAELLAAMVRDAERVSRLIHRLGPGAELTNSLMQDVERSRLSLERMGFGDIMRSYQRAMDQASMFLNQIERAARQPTSPAAVKRSVEALQARTPNVEEDLRAQIAKLKGKLAAQHALRPARQRGQQKTAVKQRKAAERFVQRVDAEMAKSDEIGLDTALVRVLKGTGVRIRRGRSAKVQRWDYTDLTPPERERAVRSARQRYRDWKKKTCVIR